MGIGNKQTLPYDFPYNETQCTWLSAYTWAMMKVKIIDNS